MGGMGSGGISRHGVVEQSFRLRLAPLLAKTEGRRDGSSFLGIMERMDGRPLCSSVERIEIMMSMGPETGSLRLRYIATTYRGQIIPVVENIDLVSAPQPFGGRQWWFRCPQSFRRVKTLYLLYGAARFASREAWGVTYASQRLSAKDRPLVRAQNIRMKLGGTPAIFDPFPDRPARMRQARYDKLREKAEYASEASMAALATWLDYKSPNWRDRRA